LTRSKSSSGVKLSTAAARSALKSWGGNPSELTHIVSTTCTHSSNPGFDHYVATALGLDPSIERVLLHGVGCSGGLGALRTACHLAMGASFLGRKARILVLACEISTSLVRSELESIVADEEVRIGVCLFSDCASALVLGNDVGVGVGDGEDQVEAQETPLLEVLGWEHRMVPESERDLGFDVHPLGQFFSLGPAQLPLLWSSWP
jgi:fungal type III polyketide synthase